MPETGFINVYHQRDEERNKVRVSKSLPHRTRAIADWAAMRVRRGTGGACYRVKVVTKRLKKGHPWW